MQIIYRGQMEILKIEQLLSLDVRTRYLSRLKDGRRVKLSVSACLCLEGLIKAEGETLSQDTLVNLGWRQVGIEVTPSSLRVTVNQLRRAFLSLQVDKDILIVTVPRMGYRLVIYSNEGSKPEAIEAADILIESDGDIAEVPVVSGAKKTRFIARYFFYFLFMSLLAGAFTAWFLSRFVNSLATPINYEPYTGPSVTNSSDAKIFVDSSRPASKEQVEKALNLLSTYAGDDKNRHFLYVNQGQNTDYTSVFSCKKELGEKQNECSSIVFRTH